MKMDAMQNRKMWKVAIAHFALTIFCLLTWLALLPTSNGETMFGLETRGNNFLVGTATVSLVIFFGLQPLIFLAFVADNMLGIRLPAIPPVLLIPLYFLSFVVCSYAFGWIFVNWKVWFKQMRNWLNHFSVFNKKTF
jgi:hypothetical protein